MSDFAEYLKDRPRHWRDMEAALSKCLRHGDLIFTSLDDLHESSNSEMRLLVARPGEGKILLVSASRSPDDDGAVSPVTDTITTGADRGYTEKGRRWNLLHRRAAVRAADGAIDGTIVHTWARIWTEGRLHVIAQISRAGMHDSLRTISVRRPTGVLRPSAQAEPGFTRPLPKLFARSRSVRVHGEIDSRNFSMKPGEVGIL